MRDELKLLK